MRIAQHLGARRVQLPRVALHLRTPRRGLLRRHAPRLVAAARRRRAARRLVLFLALAPRALGERGTREVCLRLAARCGVRGHVRTLQAVAGSRVRGALAVFLAVLMCPVITSARMAVAVAVVTLPYVSGLIVALPTVELAAIVTPSLVTVMPIVGSISCAGAAVSVSI